VRRVTKALVAALALSVAVGGASVAFVRARHTANRYGIDLCGARTTSPTPAVEFDDALLAAALVSLDDDERARVENVVNDANARWEARANPLLEDLADGEPDDELELWSSDAPASVATAFAASTTRFCAGDGFCVEAVTRTAPCSPGFARLSVAKELERARFLAWPFGYAVWLRAETPRDARAAADSLRLRAHSSSHIGLVLHSDDAQRAAEPPFADLRDRLFCHEALKAIARDAGARAATDLDASTSRLHLDPRDVVVLPSLAALTSLDAFRAELRSIAPSLQIVR